MPLRLYEGPQSTKFQPSNSSRTFFLKHQKPRNLQWYVFKTIGCQSTKFQLSTSSGTCFFKASKTSKSAMVLVNSSTGGFHALVCRSVACALSFVF
eukprot:sb/3479123/